MRLFLFQVYSSKKNFVVENDEAREVLQGETVPTVLHAFKAQLEALEVFDEASGDGSN